MSTPRLFNYAFLSESRSQENRQKANSRKFDHPFWPLEVCQLEIYRISQEITDLSENNPLTEIKQPAVPLRYLRLCIAMGFLAMDRLHVGVSIFRDFKCLSMKQQHYRLVSRHVTPKLGVVASLSPHSPSTNKKLFTKNTSTNHTESASITYATKCLGKINGKR